MALTKVSTDGVKDDAITSGKIPANAVGASELADNAVDTNAIADQAVALSKLPHGTSSNDGKFLRANNGADPSFETVTSTTINNNADNRVITGSGTANTLNGESSVTIDSSNRMMIGTTSPQAVLTLDNTGQTTQTLIHCEDTGGSGAHSHINFKNTTGDVASILTNSDNLEFRVDDTLTFNDISANEHMRLNSHGDLLIGRTSTIDTSEVLGIKGPSGDHCTFGITTDGTTNLGIIAFNDNDANFRGQIRYSHSGDVMQFHAGGSERINVSADGIKFNGDTAAANALDDYEEGSFTPTLLNAGSTTYDKQVGKYTKIGNMVWFNVEVHINNVDSGAGGTTGIGLPFNNNTDLQITSTLVGNESWDAALTTNNLAGWMSNNDNNVFFYKNSGNNLSGISVTDIGNDGEIVITLFMRTNSG